ncbi:glycosyltransferase family 25 protein [Acinetobacter kyonggiensis]|uniref:Glycosyltransferase family 25 (LPS biosynthesis protein) n=1 Tax=Acinetobacter kyonggiensis TaxID=595670 RepID=A0A1H3JXT5_9GAMM|nr:glycosyltransferase family 25 protein [Acinetobacter kyonggiensis]SDY44701.1 Glycosyltransferase family 25 (LPS biosynthesis protein) [Acinetobacter kyonggiensis]
MKNFILTLQYLYREHTSIGKLWQFFRRYYISHNLKETKQLWNRKKSFALLEKWKTKKNKKVIIFATKHTIFITELIKNCLNNSKIEYQIYYENYPKKFDDSLYIIVCPQFFKKFPECYIAFQLEQTVSTRWFSEIQIEKLKNSLLILDYSLDNIKYLSNSIPISNLYYLPISTIALKDKDTPYEYDILFYGDTNNDRRKAYINEISKYFKVKIVNNSFGENIWEYIKKSKIVLNIHYYENALLETTRIYECLSNDALIISEKSSDFNTYTDLENIVDFVEIDNIQEMIDRINFWLNESTEFIERKKLIKSYNQRNETQFDFYFHRMLLSLDIIDFDTMYNNTSTTFQPKEFFWCLSLPEYLDRNIAFQSELTKYNEISKFPGLRHKTPWIGCGLSYKYLMKFAKENNYERIIICEDDVLFPSNFDKKIDNINFQLNKPNLKWDIFSGHVTDLNKSFSAKKIGDDIFFNYINLNKTTGMVFNIYNKSIFDYLANWNYNNRHLLTNAIDRYLENKHNLEVITTTPYLVEHKENINTTLWDRNTSEFSYNSMTNSSLHLIEKEINKH